MLSLSIAVEGDYSLKVGDFKIFSIKMEGHNLKKKNHQTFYHWASQKVVFLLYVNREGSQVFFPASMSSG